MLLLRTALKNIISGGLRTWLNAAVLSFTFVIMLWYNGIIDGWISESKTETIAWEIGGGQYWMPEYDRYDIFSLQDAHAAIPESLEKHIASNEVTPILVVQGALYPQGRMVSVQLKGIDTDQDILKIPFALLNNKEGEVTALIGKRMAQSSRLKEGDYVMVRWRDRNGAFDAREIRIAGVFDSKAASIDSGQLWLSLADLQRLTEMPQEATYLVKSTDSTLHGDKGGWLYKDDKFLMADLDNMLQANRFELVMVTIILLSVSLLAVFDTQTLSIFRRQKEIGTYVALGMTQRRVTALFTLEGTAYSLLGLIVGLIWGIPLLWYQAIVGIPMPDMVTDSGLAIGNVIYPIYTVNSAITCMIVILFFSALISYLPARKIANQNIVNALKGKIS